MSRGAIGIALLSAALFGASTPLAKLLIGQMDPFLLAGLLYLGAGAGLAAVVAARHALHMPVSEAALRRDDLPWMALVILSGGILGPLLLLAGLARTEAATASLLLNLEGLATLAIAWVVFRENVDRRLLVGAAAILAGAVVLSWQGRATMDAGAALIALACVFWGIDNNLTRKLSAADPVQIAMVKGLVAGAVNLGLALVQGARLPPPPVVVASGLVGFAGFGASIALFVVALRHLGAARTGAYFSLAPFVGAVLAVGLLGEPITTGLVTAAVLMVVGVWLHLTERHQHDHVHLPLTHAHRHVHDDHHQHGHSHDDAPGEPHAHFHSHAALAHSHAHYPDMHHRHRH